MSWISKFAGKTQKLTISRALKTRLSFSRRTLGDAERDELLVKIDILTAKNSELMHVADLDAAQQKNELSDEEATILQKIAMENVESEREIADALDISLARAEYRMLRLLEKGYLVDFVTLDYHAYVLDRRGRDFLMDKGLHKFNIH
jgi:type III secretory pathway component EscV